MPSCDKTNKIENEHNIKSNKQKQTIGQTHKHNDTQTQHANQKLTNQKQQNQKQHKVNNTSVRYKQNNRRDK